MAELFQAEKEAATGIDNDGEGVQQGIASPLDCWELIDSTPGSPLPEARGNATALEEAIASACSSGSLLQDDYFGYAHTLADDRVLPLSTAMADKQNDEDDGHSLGRIEGLVFLASDTDAVGHCLVCKESASHGDHEDSTKLMGHDDCMHHEDQMDDKVIHHHDLPSCSNLLRYDDQKQHGVDVPHDHKIYDESVVHRIELLEHADRWHAEEGLHFGDSICAGSECLHGMYQSGNSCKAVEDVCAYGISSCPESPSHSSVAEPRTVDDSYMDMHQAFSEGRSSAIVLEETGSEATRQSQQIVSVKYDTTDGHGKRRHKGFAYVSWIWTHFIRWQTQFGHANSIWSVAFAAAVMGILVLARGWQRLQAQNQSLRWQLWAKEKRITQLMFQLMQTKDALVKVRRVPVICVKPSLQIPQDDF